MYSASTGGYDGCSVRALFHLVSPLNFNVDKESRGLHNPDAYTRSRLYYLFYKFIKENRQEIPIDLSSKIIDTMRDLLPVEAEIPSDLEDAEFDILGEIVRNSTFDSQLYLFESAGILTSLNFKTPETQASLLLSLVKPLMNDLSLNLQIVREKGWNKDDLDTLMPIVKMHHVIMALGNIAKGFPDYPTVIPENYIMPPLDVFVEVAKAILVCLEAMNVLKVIRDAVRFLCFSLKDFPAESLIRRVLLLLGCWLQLDPRLRLLFRHSWGIYLRILNLRNWWIL